MRIVVTGREMADDPTKDLTGGEKLSPIPTKLADAGQGRPSSKRRAKTGRARRNPISI
jgi:hypothetical protein